MVETERDDIKRLTLEIMELCNDPKNRIKIKQDVIAVQFSVNKISSYVSSENYRLNALADMAVTLLTMLSGNPPEDVQKAADEMILNPPDELRKKLESKKFGRKPLLNIDYPVIWGFTVDGLNKYCCYVNSLRFNITGKWWEIFLHKINLNLGYNINL